jgi:hypothetical protein
LGFNNKNAFVEDHNVDSSISRGCSRKFLITIYNKYHKRKTQLGGFCSKTLVPVYHLGFRVGATAIAAAADSTINFWPERLHKVTLTLTHSVVSFILENSIS